MFDVPKRLFCAAMLSILTLLLAACGDATATPVPAAAPTSAAATTVPASAATPAPSVAAGSTLKAIALVVGVKGDPFYVTMEKGARAKAQELGVDLIVDGPADFKPELQTPIVDALIARGISTLIIAPTDKQAMIAPLKRASDAGITVITVDTFIGDGDYDKGTITFPLSYIGSDNTQGGKVACDALIKAMGGKGTVYIQNVKPGISTTDQREQGCKESIAASNGSAQVLKVDYNDDSAATAAQQSSAVLQSTSDLGGIFGTNLFGAEGAAQAVKNANKQGVVRIASFDAPEQAIKDLKAGTVDIVIAQQPSLMGSTAVEYAVNALKGNTSSIKKRVPTGYVVIDKNNVDSPEAQNAIYKSS